MKKCFVVFREGGTRFVSAYLLGEEIDATDLMVDPYGRERGTITVHIEYRDIEEE